MIDNEPRGSARDLVEGFAACPQVPVHNENETAPAILAARNHASDTADDIDLLVFIDDVERPSEQWLSLLIHTWLTYRCAVVVGPVISGYEVEPDVWVGLAASSTVRPTMS